MGEQLARILWADADPLGQSFTFDERQYRVVGLVREVHYPSLEAGLDAPEFYVPFIDVGGQVSLSVGCSAHCPGDAEIRHVLMTAHPAVRVGAARPLEAQFNEQLARPRAAAALASTFAVTALVAAAAGLFSVLTYAVNRRRKEFGVRTALGASPASIRHLVMRDGLLATGIGILLGGIAAAALSSTLSALQYGVSLTDRSSFLFVGGLIALTALLATWRPAAQAVRTDPVLLLKDE